MPNFAEVIVDISASTVDKIFDYAIVDPVAIGMRVLVPFGPRKIEGFVVNIKGKSLLDPKKIKPITEVLDAIPVITSEMMALKDYLSQNFRLRMVDVLRLFIPSQMRKGRIKELTRQFVELNPEFISKNIDDFIKPSAVGQRELFEYLLENKDTPILQSEITTNFSNSSLKNLIMRDIIRVKAIAVRRTPYKNLSNAENEVNLTDEQKAVLEKIEKSDECSFLLHGVTGSGKTEVYMRAIASSLAKGQTAIMLVPEIALTPQVLKNFRARFGDKVALLHSALSAGERFDEWRRLLTGEALVAVGARSAVFAPLSNVGIIIVDEEHDSSYTADSNPRYHAIEIAHFRQKFNKAKLILGSATPSIENYYRAKVGELTLLEMPTRVNQKPLPEIELVNMCNELYEGNNDMFSRSLLAKLRECVDNENQAMLFINRRGYSSYVICRSCGHVPKCEACDVSLVYHKEDKTLKCHYCSARYSSLDVCPKCKSNSIRQGYVGTERVVERLQALFPDKNILRMDNDTTRTKDSHSQILEKFAKKEASILVGTQMIAKGHDFPNVTLVGILDADLSLYFSDFRSVERTYSLITQVSGRAGREEKQGKVVLQTYSPRHYVFKYAMQNDYKTFFEKECNLREVTKYPPFATIYRIMVSSENEEQATAALKNIFDKLTALSKESQGSFAYLAAMRSPVKRIQNKHRMQVISRIVCRNDMHLDEITPKIYEIAESCQSNTVTVFVEKNPNSLS